MKHIRQNLHIAIVSDAVYPYNIGGKEKRIYELTKRLAAKGHTVTIYCMKWWKEDKQTIQHEGVIFEAISPYFPLYAGERRSIKQGIMFALYTLQLLKKQFDVIDIDHMPHLVLFPTKLVAILKRKKMIATWHEVWGRTYWVKYLGNLGYVAHIVEKMSILLPDSIISGSQHTAERLSAEFGRTKHVYSIPNGIAVRQMVEIKPAKVGADIIFAGRLLQHKNVDMLINAIGELRKSHKNITCFIIGNGPEEQSLKQLVVKLELQKQITFLDFLEDNIEFYSLIKRAKVFVLPSSREGFGIATIEAQALGVPVITYNHPHNGSRKLINEGINGYLFDNKRRTLAETIDIVLKNNLDSNKITASVAHYDWDVIVKKVEEVYKQ